MRRITYSNKSSLMIAIYALTIFFMRGWIAKLSSIVYLSMLMNVNPIFFPIMMISLSVFFIPESNNVRWIWKSFWFLFFALVMYFNFRMLT